MTQHHGSAADFAALKGMRPFDEFEITSGAGAGNVYRHYGQAGWLKISSGGTAHVADPDNLPGIATYRWVSVTGDTASTLAGSGCATYTVAVHSPVIDSIRIVSGQAALLALVVAGTANLVIRAALDAGNDAAALALLPDTFPASSRSDNAGQIRSFTLVAKVVSAALDANRVVILELPPNIGDLLHVSATGITRLDFVHELAGVVLQFGIAAVEAV